MRGKLSIHIKAAFLLLVFGLNTVIGFACAIGIGMGYNRTHHHDKEVAEVHVHKDGSKHEHKKHGHLHTPSKDDCCSNSVVKVAQADKAVPGTAKLLNPVFFTAFAATTCYELNLAYPSQVKPSNKYYVRGHHPPIPDIRIAIQSFQI